MKYYLNKFKSFVLFVSIALLNLAYGKQLQEKNTQPINLLSQQKQTNIDQVNNNYFNLPSVKVKGYGFIQKFKDISGSVNIFTKEDIVETHSVNLNDLISKVPGFQSLEFAIVDYMVIRGTASMYDLKGKSHSVFINDIPLASTEAKNIFLTDNIASVEVLKGPQNVLYGSNARSGAINIYMDRPNKTQGQLSVGIGNQNSHNLSLNTNLHVNEALDIGFLISKDYQGGFINNTALNVKKGGHNDLLYNFNIYFKPTDKTLFNIFYLRNKPTYKKPSLVMFDQNQNPVLYNISSFDDSSSLLIGPRLDFYQERTDYGGTDKRDTRASAFKIEHEFNDNITLIGVISQSHFNQHSLLDLDMNDIAWINKIGALNVVNDYKATSKYNDLKLMGDYEKIKWIAGISKTEDQNRRLASGHPFNTEIRAMRIGDIIKGKAAYTKFKLLPNKYFDVDIGYRRQIDKATPQYFPVSDNQTINKIYNILNPLIKKALHKQELPDHLSNSENLWTGTITYHLNSNTNFYATIAKGYVSGGYESFITNAIVKPEHGIARELGLKSQLLNDRLFLVAAAFDNKYKDYQFFNFLKYSMDNVPHFISKGYELSAYLIVTPNIMLGATYSKVNPKIKDYKMTDLFGLADSGLYDSYSNITTFHNKKIPWVPEKNATLNLVFNKKIKSVDITWNNSLSIRGKMPIDFGNQLNFKNVNLFDSTIILKTNKKNEFILWGKNLTNKKYWSSGFSSGINVGVYGQSKTYGIGYKTRF